MNRYQELDEQCHEQQLIRPRGGIAFQIRALPGSCEQEVDAQRSSAGHDDTAIATVEPRKAAHEG
jgi:hypothetical protein